MTFDERTERNIASLHPRAQEKAREFMQLAVPLMKRYGLDVRIISGLRTFAEQDALYAQGRTAKGRIVTNARAGFSNHNFGTAFDIGLFEGKKYLDESPKYKELGQAGKSLGLVWGGDFKSIKDEPHFEIPTGLTLAEMRKRIADKRDIFA
jgi:peptidoglycan L-alanyl-D-glutamate endopeptidase CwlK